jgi:hypothetical protein
MKREVYSWRLAAERKVELEEEARSEGSSLSSLRERVADDWLAERRNGNFDDEGQAGCHPRARHGRYRLDPRRGSHPLRSSQRTRTRDHGPQPRKGIPCLRSYPPDFYPDCHAHCQPG